MQNERQPDKNGSTKQKRQKKGTGSFTHHEDGTVEYRVSLGVRSDGSRWRPSSYGDSEASALQAYRDWMKCSPDMPLERVKTVKEWANTWLEVYKSDTKKNSYKSYKNYELYVTKHIVPSLGALRLDQVRQAHIVRFINSKASLSASALQYLKISLNGIFDTAIKNHFCKENPVDGVEFPKKLKKKPKSFTPREIGLIFEFAPYHKSGNLVLGLLHTAMREGELAALLWSNVHLDEKYIDICCTVAEVECENKDTLIVGGKEKHHKKYEIKWIPKGDHDRAFALTTDAVEFFQSLPRTNAYIFPSLSGSFMTPNQLREQYNQFFKALNKMLDEEKSFFIKTHGGARPSDLEDFKHVRMLSPHKCRHTYGAQAIRSGISMRILQEQLGHRQITTTEVYSNLDIEDRISKIDDLKF